MSSECSKKGTADQDVVQAGSFFVAGQLEFRVWFKFIVLCKV